MSWEQAGGLMLAGATATHALAGPAHQRPPVAPILVPPRGVASG